MNKYIYVFLLIIFNLSAYSDTSLSKMMQEMMEGQEKMMDDFFNNQDFSGTNQPFNKLQFIQKKSSIEKINGKTFEKIEVYSKQKAHFNIEVKDQVIISSTIKSKSQYGESESSSQQIFPIPDNGVYREQMTQKQEGKVTLFFEVPANHKISSLGNPFSGIRNKLRQFEDQRDDYPEERRRKAIIPQKKI